MPNIIHVCIKNGIFNELKIFFLITFVKYTICMLSIECCAPSRVKHSTKLNALVIGTNTARYLRGLSAGEDREPERVRIAAQPGKAGFTARADGRAMERGARGNARRGVEN